MDLRQRTKSPCPPMDGLAVARRLTSAPCSSLLASCSLLFAQGVEGKAKLKSGTFSG